MKIIHLLPLVLLLNFQSVFAQKVEVGIIESFVYDNNPDTLVLTVSTDLYCTATAILTGGGTFTLSDTMTDFHSGRIALSEQVRKTDIGTFYLILVREDGITDTSELFEFDNYKDTAVVVESETGAGFYSCLTGGFIYLIPSVYFHNENGKQSTGIGKEFPIISFFSGGFNYPASYLSLEYRYLLKDIKPAHELSTGWKYMWQPPGLEYIAPGVSVFTDFLGNNGIGGEISLGLFKFYDVFTVYGKFRYHHSMAESKRTFTDLSVGLYSSFFSIHR